MVGKVLGAAAWSAPPGQANPAPPVPRGNRGCACHTDSSGQHRGDPEVPGVPHLGFLGVPQMPAADTAGTHPCSRMREGQVILVWPAASCPLQGCASCHSWPLRHFSVPALMLVAATVHQEPCQEKSCTITNIVWEEAAFLLPSPEKKDCIMKLGTTRWYGFKLPAPFSWVTREQQSHKKSHVNHGYSRKEQSAASLKIIGKMQYYQTGSSYTGILCGQSSISGTILSKEEASFFILKGQFEQRKWTLSPYFCELAPPLPEITIGESQWFSFEAAKFSLAAAAGLWGISENNWEIPRTL